MAQDAQGTKVDLGPSQVDGAVLSAPWPATAAAGQYRVSYRAVAEDGHPLEGTINFTIKGDAAPEVSPSPAAQEQNNGSSSAAKIWAPIALLAALLVAGGLFWRSRAQLTPPAGSCRSRFWPWPDWRSG
ncbi:MAG: copper resistance protein CopC [Candidatus Nanopelagicales bacterium]